jgi:hypothetical protein
MAETKGLGVGDDGRSRTKKEFYTEGTEGTEERGLAGGGPEEK